MGSSSASSSASSDSSSVLGSSFQRLSLSEECKRYHDGYKSTNCIYLKRVPTISKAAYKGVKAGRILGGIFTLGLTEAGYGIYKLSTSAGDGPNHYYLEMEFECSKCHRSRAYIVEFFNDSEIKFHPGYYCYGTIRERKYGDWSYYDIERIIERIKNQNWKYNSANWNCQHFARYIFYKRL